MNADILALIRTPEAEKAMENEVEAPRVVAELAPPVEETSYRVSSLIAVIGAGKPWSASVRPVRC